ncbi:hypothetical protein [Leptospira santarosai]|uniref:Uncharacterized protein n=1 Tax=Leptospira santarosai TaxID=28183 RepID=A0AB73M6G9_9LEPT|nr:hypothetical protein [Leptospira santarosai]ASV12344.1 hypothetical protein B2G51_12340 [Leptospira santarosai]MDI7175041.1 hypothetical protein [Leptospira santarosai]MDI7194686.1 hypothetical protein [Leptospira santarosai]MDO6395590.1 hypothetical protein [Leptospira santarosai]MDO6399092.1 hypothetical protein [Leptospira santarosai]
MDANTGQSSGGHTGIRVGNKVYHYQFFPDEIFHLVRETYDDFAFDYNIISNRTSVLTRLKLTQQEISVLESELDHLYLVQFRHLQNLEMLKKETKFFEELNSPEKKIGLRATAYFAPGEKSKLAKDLKSKLTDALGKNFLNRLEQTLKDEILSPNNELLKMEFPPLPETMNRDKFPFFKPGSYLKIRDILEGILFCQILGEEWNLNEEFKISNTTEPLTEREKILLENFNAKQTEGLVQILTERDPGWAYSALVTLGRLHTIEESIRTGFPMFLSSFPDNPQIFYREDSDDTRALRHIAEETIAIESLARKKISGLRELTEKEYQIWEDVSNRTFELRKRNAIRATWNKLLPQRENKFLIPMRLPENSALAEYLKLAKTRESEYHVRLKKLYPFRLLSENCTTEILKNVQNSFDRKGVPFPGEKIDFGFSPAFIPFYASRWVSNNWNNEGKKIFLSYRRKKLAELLKQNPNWKIHWRESFTFSSSIYKSNREDHFFPLFTDDVFWSRPFYGIVNLTAGLGATLIGIIVSPLDGGERFQKGFQSLFFSFPELAFFNIRKGTFPMVSIKEIPDEYFQFQDEE